MFLDYIKEFFVKKSLKNNLNTIKNEVFTSNIQTIGLLVDESKFRNSNELIQELVLNGIAPENIKIARTDVSLRRKKHIQDLLSVKNISIGEAV